MADAHFSIAPGEIFGLLGPNGAGKTTTLKMLVGLLPPTSGHARLCGVDVATEPLRARRKLGYMSATSGLPGRLSAREVLRLFAGIHGVADPATAAERAVQRFSLGAFADRLMDGYSTGMRQRARLAVATVHDPPVLILDEPTSGLDVVAAQELLDVVQAAREGGAAVLFSTHILAEAEQLCNRVAVLQEGHLLAIGSVPELCRQTGATELQGAFLGLIRQARAAPR